MHAGITIIGIGSRIRLEVFAADVGASMSACLGRDRGRGWIAVSVVIDHPHVGLFEGSGVTDDDRGAGGDRDGFARSIGPPEEDAATP